METKAFPSKITMLQYLVNRVEGLDLNSSAFLPKFSFVTDKGDQLMCPNTMTFVQEFNKAFGSILDMNGCRATGRNRCILTFLEKKDLDKPAEVITEIIIPEETIVEPEVIPETSSEEYTPVKFNLDYATSLQEDKSKKEAKDALEIYGRALNVELNKQLTFANMLKTLQESL